MLAEFFKALREQSAAVAKLEIVPIPGDPRNVFVVQGASSRAHELPRPVINETLRSFDDVLARAVSFAESDPVEVYYDESGIVVLHDAGDRRERSTMPISTSERWAAVCELAKGFTGTQKETIHFLRFVLGVERTEQVLVGVRRLDFVRNSTGRSSAEHGRESLGKSVELAVQQADQIPDEFEVSVCPVTNRGLQGISVTVRIGVVLDLEQQRVVLRALPDSVQRARNAWLGEIGTRLDATLAGKAVVLHGSP